MFGHLDLVCIRHLGLRQFVVVSSTALCFPHAARAISCKVPLEAFHIGDTYMHFCHIHLLVCIVPELTSAGLELPLTSDFIWEDT